MAYRRYSVRTGERPPPAAARLVGRCGALRLRLFRLGRHGRHRYLSLGTLQQNVQLGYITAMRFLLGLEQLILATELVFEELILLTDLSHELLIGRSNGGDIFADRRVAYGMVQRFGWVD